MDQIKDNIYHPPIKHLSHIDSVNNVLNTMQLKIDNLEKIVVKTEIGTSFFWSVIGLQLAVFVVLVGIGGWIGWSSIMARFNTIKKECTDGATELIEQTKTEFHDNYKKLNDNLKDTIFDVNRAMFFVSQASNDHENSFDWAMITAISIVPNGKGVEKDLEIWIDLSLEHLSKLEIGDEVILRRRDGFPNRIKKIEALAKGTLLDKIETLKKDFYHKAYTVEQPPADLMEGASPTPPEPITESPTEN